MKKKGQLANLQAMVAPLVGVAIVLVIGFLIMAEAKTQTTENTTAWNGTNEVIEAMEDIPGWLPIIVITIIGSVLLGLVAYFRSR